MTAWWQIGFAQWQRRWRLSEMRLLFLALLVSATAVSSVGFFTSRVDQAMQKQARQFLGGDLVLTSSRPLAESYVKQAQQLGIQVARTVEFNSMVMVGERLQLAEIKAVTPNYPLQGELEGTEQLGGLGKPLPKQGLPSGELWAESRLYNELAVAPGAEAQLGEKAFRLTKVLTRDPTETSNPFQLAANVLMPLADLPATALLSEASRARYSLMFVGSSAAIRTLQDAVTLQLQPTERIRTLQEGVPAVQQALERAGRFLGLAALLSVVLAGAAIALSASSLIRHETRAVAVLKAFGLGRKRILLDYLFNLLTVALLAGLLGAALGFGLQFILARWLANMVVLVLPAPTLLPALTALLTALVMVVGFAVPYLLNLVNQAPVRILQGGLPLSPAASWTLAGVLPAIFGLLWLQAGEWWLAIWLFFGLLAALLLFWWVSRLLLNALVTLSGRSGWEWLGVLRQARRSSLLVVVFSMGLFALLLLTALRTDLVERWQATLPDDAPNYFMINIQPDEVTPLQAFFKENGLQGSLFPMIRGRLVEVNGKPITADQFDSEQTKRLLSREFNLSSFADLPSSNTIIAGEWFTAQRASGFSIEQGIGETLSVGLGDKLTFDIAGQRYTESITSVRTVRWDSMQPNFFVIAGPGAFQDKPRTYITSLYVAPAKPQVVPALIQRFPAITAIDTGAVVKQVRTLIDQATFAVQGIFAFTLVTGVLVLLAALQSQQAERRREIAVLKSLGAVRAVLRQRIIIEFVLLGGLAGTMAGLFTVLVSNIVGYYLFDLSLNLNVWLVALGLVLGALLVGAAAYVNLRGLLAITPVSLLKG